MRKLLLIPLLTIGLGGCAMLPTVNLANTVNLNTLEGVVSGYGLVLNAENTYKALPLCKTGTSPGVTNICAKRSVIVRLQTVDKTANLAVNNAVNFVKTNPNVDPTQYIAAAQNALIALQGVLNSANSGT